MGPFPKTKRWRELAISAGIEDSDAAIERMRLHAQRLSEDRSSQRAILFWIALLVCTRCAEPQRALKGVYGIEIFDGSTESLVAALDRFAPEHTAAKRASAELIREVNDRPSSEEKLIAASPWNVWREYDFRIFCNLAQRYFALLNCEILSCEVARVLAPEERRLAEELSVITKTFSARWFNACARENFPESGSIVWYFRHCMGKLDLEFAREASDWDELEKGPKRRVHQATLDF